VKIVGMHREFEGSGAVWDVEICTVMFLYESTSYSLVRHFCCWMYRLATMLSVETGRKTDRMPIAVYIHTNDRLNG